ncbi:hypothetical protein CA267_001740 [Alteromonas pelagimontana]|uniref:Phage tail protein n=1 Tax=Alteromonas pelagimontana TaxID=1858656 RepID=A0A6M4MBT3_9ALTE|nr:phage tail tube protein [Alteromonas pelagimontana]QJR79606.1 hypothetical protein CA267_001740 [Alteromonas pelagimontana]
MLTTREAIALKIESTPGTESAPDPLVDSILVSAVSISNEGLRMIERPNIKPSIATDQQIFGGTMKKLSFTAELKGSGTAGTAPEIGQSLRACGLSETIGAGTVTYAPVSDGHESATIYYYQDGRLYKLLGCKGNVTLNAEAGALGTAQFEFTGHDGGLADALFPTLAYNSTVPKPFIKVAFKIDEYGAIINSLSLNAGNNIVINGDVSSDWGFGDVEITKRDPNGTIDPRAVSLATKNFYTAFKDGTRLALSTGPVGSTTGNRYQIDASIAIRELAHGEREQIRTDDLTFGCHETNGDDDWSITFS